MKLIDTNVLLYAVNASAAHHPAAKRWLDHALSGGAPVGFAWLALAGFVRVATHASVFEHPLAVEQAMDQVNSWLGAPSAQVLHPGPEHAVVLRTLLTANPAAGNLTNDAHLAALAIEHRSTVVTFDADFARFQGVRSERPT